MSIAELKKLRRVEKLVRRLLSGRIDPVHLAQFSKSALVFKGSASQLTLSNAVMRDLIRELME